MAAIFDVSAPRFEEAYWPGRLSFDQGALTAETYWAQVAAALSRGLSHAQRERLIELDNASWSYPDPRMVQWAVELRRAGLRTAVLSNMPITLRTALRQCAWLPEFDHSCYSCDVRHAKPEPEIFHECLQGVGVAANEALFLDDREENVAAARQLGIHTIHFQTPEQAQGEIDRHYQLPLAIPLNGKSAALAE